MEEASGAQVLAGKYKLVHLLGKGGMGSVWLAHHLTLQSPVAIKLIDPQIASNPEALGRFMREARAAAALRSPHVVQILDHGIDGTTPYIAMELLEGESLAARLRKVGRLPPEDAARILTHTARAVSRAHEVGVVHRDLKPDNIFLSRTTRKSSPRCSTSASPSRRRGLGVSAIAETRTGAIIGTPHYMSPEQAEGVKPSTTAPISGRWASSRSSACSGAGRSRARRSGACCSRFARGRSRFRRSGHAAAGSTPGSRRRARAIRRRASRPRVMRPPS